MANVDQEVNSEFYNKAIGKFINKIYKILATAEENGKYLSLIDSTIKQLMGFYETLENYEFLEPGRKCLKYQQNILNIIWKLNSLKFLVDITDYKEFRSNIFDCISILSKMKEDDRYEMYSQS